MEAKAYSETLSPSNGIGYCIGGSVALIVGLFVFGIPCGLLAISLGKKGIAHGANVFGAIVKVGGWIEVVATFIGFVFMMGAQ
ncbi:MAG: hypothetical protein ONB44_24125 [candidate division KSB1 bacterium]|nr:hypothetical protein [candidate division KSB1 bacterium]MDZ7305230.1 hypothetical protein [candidate division KSB1 bacterium]MDZ7314341.1 hypothetical protein [candidate division KSB1 bacterium]